jgi:hypothetical protein
MSHYSQVTSEMNDITAIKKACADLGLMITEGGQVGGYYGKGSNAEWVISGIGGKYEIGLVKDQVSGNYRMVYDKWDGSIEGKLGTDCYKLTQSATFHKFAETAESMGWDVQTPQRIEQDTLECHMGRWVND